MPESLNHITESVWGQCVHHLNYGILYVRKCEKQGCTYFRSWKMHHFTSSQPPWCRLP